MRPDRDLAGTTGQEVLVIAGGFGLTPAKDPAPPAGSQPRGMAWPVRSGLVPPLADGFVARPETAPDLEAALYREPRWRWFPADYFLVRRGRYDVASFFTADGAYGRFAWRRLLAYAIGLGAEWPFVSHPDYTGPLVKTLGGADISWLIGWFAAAIVYLLLVALAPGTAARRGRPIAAGAR